MKILAVLLLLSQVFHSQFKSDAPYFCGRKCNCGQGYNQEVVTPDGKIVKGTVKPVNYACTCAELYLCDLAKEGAPAAVVTMCQPSFGLGGSFTPDPIK